MSKCVFPHLLYFCYSTSVCIWPATYIILQYHNVLCQLHDITNVVVLITLVNLLKLVSSLLSLSIMLSFLFSYSSFFLIVLTVVGTATGKTSCETFDLGNPQRFVFGGLETQLSRE